MQSNITLPKIFPVTAHTDYVGKGSTFFAFQGQKIDGVTFIAQAIAKGATHIVVQENATIPDSTQKIIVESKVKLLRVHDMHKSFAQMCADAAFGAADRLNIYAITGTKGKTTTAYVLRNILDTAGKKTALLTTAGNYIVDSEVERGLTTPQPDFLHQFFATCVKYGVTDVVMEVSAQALSLERVYDLQFVGIIFTNFAHEHLEFYDSLQQYFAAKCKIFAYVKSNAPIVLNADDSWTPRTLQYCKNPVFFTLKQIPAQVTGAIVEDRKYIDITMRTSDGCCSNSTIRLRCDRLYGKHNAYNIIAAATLAKQLHLSDKAIISGVQNMKPIPGRLQEAQLKNGAIAVIDYAHNPSSYESLLSCLVQKTKQLIVVFGAGGNKDKFKRPHMGRIVATYAKNVIITQDNPRDEKQSDIVTDIMKDMTEVQKQKCTIIDDREKAISYAYQISNDNSIIAILGKGNDNYQEVAGGKTYFSDFETISQFLD